MNQNEIVPEQLLALGQLKRAPSLIQKSEDVSGDLHPSASPIVPDCSSLWFVRILLRILKRREFTLRTVAMEGSRIPWTMVPLSQPCEVMSPRDLHFPVSPDKLLQSTPSTPTLFRSRSKKIIFSEPVF